MGRALALLDGDALALRDRIKALLEQLPAVDPRALHALGDRAHGTDPAPLAAFVDTRQCLAVRAARRRARRTRPHGAPGRGLGQGQRAARDVETYNLERKPYVFNVFGWLAEAARG